MSSGSGLSVEERYQLLRSVGEECIQESELRNLLEKKPEIRCYDGFEPSGRMHIAQGIFKSVNVNKCTTAGCQFIFWVADWFALMNDKVGGEMEKIQTVGKYLIEVWKSAGMDMEKVEFLWASNEITTHASSYWKMVLDVGRRNTIARIKKCCTIMGKNEGTLTAAQILYPLMQCSDIFFLKADICQLGLDQRKVNMLAREYCDLTGRKLKPVILSHHMLAGLKQGQAKMSKSDPDSAIFMEDSAEDVRRKILQAYCPKTAQQESVVTEDGAPESTDDKNPVLDYFQSVIFSRPGASLSIDGKEFKEYKELEDAFLGGAISEEVLKETLIDAINNLLEPVRHHFETNEEAKQLLELVMTYRKGGAALEKKIETEYVAPSHPVGLIWLPAQLKVSVDIALAIVKTTKTFLDSNNGAEMNIVLPLWSAMSADEITGEEKDIKAALDYNITLLKHYGLPENLKIISQEDLILSDPNAYWFTTINVGRKNTLSHIEELYGGSVKNAGQVIAALMRVSDALSVKATHVFPTSWDGPICGLVSEFTADQVQILPVEEGSILPLNRPDAAATTLGADDVLYLDDTDMDIRRKIKKAYAAPNERENPIIAIGVHCIQSKGELLVERNEANGGNVTYTSAEKLREDCESGALHPGDLKSSVSKEVLSASQEVRAALSTPEVKKLSQTLKNAEKKLAKKK